MDASPEATHEWENTLRRSSIAALVATAVLATTLTAIPANAAGPSAGGAITIGGSSTENVTPINSNVDSAFVSKWDPYVTLSGKTFVLNAPDSLVLADPEGYAQAAEVVSETNALNATTASSVTNPLKKSTAGKTIASTGSHGGYTSYWWGWSAWVDGIGSDRIVKALTLGAASATAIGVISAILGVSAVVAGAIAAVLALAAAVFDACNWNGNGWTYKYIRVGGSVCWPR